MKTEFELVSNSSETEVVGHAYIIDDADGVCVRISTIYGFTYIKSKDLERFAINILKACKRIVDNP